MEGVRLGYSSGMSSMRDGRKGSASTPSRRTIHAELLRLCARIGYSPPGHPSR
jgi:hypothetical protein